MKHLMVDIETLSAANDAAIIAIGAVIFDRNGLYDSTSILLDPIRTPGDRSSSTWDWWMKQDPEVMTRMMSGKRSPEDAVVSFTTFCRVNKPQRIWANAPTFDCIILRNFYRSVGEEFPIHFRDERCFRTVSSMARSKGVNLQPAYEGIVKHDALSDAIAQAKAIQICMKEFDFD